MLSTTGSKQLRSELIAWKSISCLLKWSENAFKMKANNKLARPPRSLLPTNLNVAFCMTQSHSDSAMDNLFSYIKVWNALKWQLMISTCSENNASHILLISIMAMRTNDEKSMCSVYSVRGQWIFIENWIIISGASWYTRTQTKTNTQQKNAQKMKLSNQWYNKRYTLIFVPSILLFGCAMLFDGEYLCFCEAFNYKNEVVAK